MNPVVVQEIAPHRSADLDERIATAFGEGAKSDEVASLIKETEAAAITAGEVAEQARTQALDPVRAANDVAAARRRMENAQFRRERLETAVVRLKDRLQELRANEEDARRWTAYKKAEVERDALAEELGRVYVPIATQLAHLFGRIAASDRELQHNRALPRSADHLRSAELVARNLEAGKGAMPRGLRSRRSCAFRHSVTTSSINICGHRPRGSIATISQPEAGGRKATEH